jgi:hypothetical protein
MYRTTVPFMQDNAEKLEFFDLWVITLKPEFSKERLEMVSFCQHIHEPQNNIVRAIREANAGTPYFCT